MNPPTEPSSGAPSKSNWGLPEERAFMETLMMQRFNFFLVFYGLVVATLYSSKTLFQFQAASFLGTLILGQLALLIFGAQLKLESILKRIWNEPDHAISLIHFEYSGISIRWMIGVTIPFMCVGSLAFAALVSMTDLFPQLRTNLTGKTAVPAATAPANPQP